MASPVAQLPASQPVTAASTSTSNSTTTEYTVRLPNDKKKRFSMIKFSTGTDLDFLKLTQTSVKMERENNLKDYKSIYEANVMPKFGAGSEFGREQKEEARRKKYGINIKKYNADNQPWTMKIGSGKQSKRYKGVREGTITENTSYYIFTKCADGAFEAIPVEEWYNFQPMIKYKFLNSDEAEDEFQRRDRTMNLFSVMVRKRVKNEKDVEEPDDEEKKTKSKKTSKKDSSLQLTDMDDWGLSSDGDDDEDEEGGDDESKPKKEKKPKKGKKVVKNRNAKHNSDDEAIEESDEGDFDDREVDYITDSGDSDSSTEDKDKEDKYNDKGVDQETGLKKLIDSGESSEEEENKKEEEEGEDKAEAEKPKANGDESDSSSSSSGSESDIEKETMSSAVFMQNKKGSKGSRSNTPTTDVNKDRPGMKRKLDDDDSTAKKMRTESPQLSSISSGEITEEAIRRYLLRKPMTAKELVQKFRSKKPQMTKEQMIHKIGQLLKKINPEKKYVNNTLYLSVKKGS